MKIRAGEGGEKRTRRGGGVGRTTKGGGKDGEVMRKGRGEEERTRAKGGLGEEDKKARRGERAGRTRDVKEAVAVRAAAMGVGRHGYRMAKGEGAGRMREVRGVRFGWWSKRRGKALNTVDGSANWGGVGDE